MFCLRENCYIYPALNRKILEMVHPFPTCFLAYCTISILSAAFKVVVIVATCRGDISFNVVVAQFKSRSRSRYPAQRFSCTGITWTQKRPIAKYMAIIYKIDHISRVNYSLAITQQRVRICHQLLLMTGTKRSKRTDRQFGGKRL